MRSVETQAATRRHESTHRPPQLHYAGTVCRDPSALMKKPARAKDAVRATLAVLESKTPTVERREDLEYDGASAARPPMPPTQRRGRSVGPHAAAIRKAVSSLSVSKLNTTREESEVGAFYDWLASHGLEGYMAQLLSNGFSIDVLSRGCDNGELHRRMREVLTFQTEADCRRLLKAVKALAGPERH